MNFTYHGLILAVYFMSRILEHSLGHYIFLDIFYCIQSATITVFISVTAEISTIATNLIVLAKLTISNIIQHLSTYYKSKRHRQL